MMHSPSAWLHRISLLDCREAGKDTCPDSAVLDINMPGMSGIDVAWEILRLGLKTKVVILTMFDDESSMLESLRAGVKGYVLKSQASVDLTQALFQIECGRTYLSPGIAETLVEEFLHSEDTGLVDLALRERQVLQLVAEGKVTREIARLLHLTIKTIESHRNQLMKKLKVNNVAGLVRQAVKQRVISIPCSQFPTRF